MDEADFLGDKIAIMAEGQLMCCGSPMFLKDKFGTGFSMNITKAGLEVNSDVIVKKVKDIIANAELLNAAGTNISLTLPRDSIKQFEGLCKTIDGMKQQIGIMS
jgi:ATP-binding cassette subfamily A (ABC1) protein 3